MFNSWRTSVIVISVFVVLSVIAGILIAVFAHKNKGKMLVFLLFNLFFLQIRQYGFIFKARQVYLYRTFHTQW